MVPGNPEEGCSIQLRGFKENILGEAIPELPCWMSKRQAKERGKDIPNRGDITNRDKGMTSCPWVHLIPFMLMEWMAHCVSDIILGAGYMVANRTKSLSWGTLCSAGFRAHRSLSIAGGPTGKQGVMVEETEEEEDGSLFSVEELNW